MEKKAFFSKKTRGISESRAEYLVYSARQVTSDLTSWDPAVTAEILRAALRVTALIFQHSH